METLLQRLGYDRRWPVVSLGTAYLRTESSLHNKELYKSFGAVWNPEFRQWTLPPGRDLRRAYGGGWIIDGDTVYLEAMKQWLLMSRRPARRMRLRRAARNHG